MVPINQEEPRVNAEVLLAPLPPQEPCTRGLEPGASPPFTESLGVWRATSGTGENLVPHVGWLW